MRRRISLHSSEVLDCVAWVSGVDGQLVVYGWNIELGHLKLFFTISYIFGVADPETLSSDGVSSDIVVVINFVVENAQGAEGTGQKPLLAMHLCKK